MGLPNGGASPTCGYLAGPRPPCDRVSTFDDTATSKHSHAIFYPPRERFVVAARSSLGRVMAELFGRGAACPAARTGSSDATLAPDVFATPGRCRTSPRRGRDDEGPSESSAYGGFRRSVGRQRCAHASLRGPWPVPPGKSSLRDEDPRSLPPSRPKRNVFSFSPGSVSSGDSVIGFCSLRRNGSAKNKVRAETRCGVRGGQARRNTDGTAEISDGCLAERRGNDRPPRPTHPTRREEGGTGVSCSPFFPASRKDASDTGHRPAKRAARGVR